MAKEGKILITGAAGFIGSHLVELLAKEQGRKNLRLFVKYGESLKNLPDSNFDIVFGDIRNPKDVAAAMKDVGVVYHLAARIDFDGKTYKEYESVNVDGTRNLLDACKGEKIKKFVLFSSIGVYGLPAGIGKIDGWDETHPKTYTNYYGRSKLEAEELVVNAGRGHNLPYAIIRPASVYGPREKGPTLALFKVIKSGSFFMIGNGENLMHYIFVTDLVEAARKAETSKLVASDYIVAGNRPEKFNNVVRCIAESINAKVVTVKIPKWVALSGSYLLEVISKITGIKFPLFPSRVETMTTSYYYDVSKVRNELGWKPSVSFIQGAKITGHWYQEHGYI